MSLDSSQNAENRSILSVKFGEWVLRLVLAIVLSLGIAMFVGMTAWSRVPYTENELRSVETSDESKVRELRNQEITQLRIALGRRLPGNRQAELYHRLAEIYLEAYRATYLMEGRVHEKRLEAKQEDKTIDHSHSKPYLALGIKACNEILRLKIPFSKLDQIYYFLGFNYGETGNKKESIRHYEYLTQKFPSSEFASEAHRELGDYAFDAAQFKKAVTYYEMGVRKANSDRLPRIYHKLAWSYYRTKQFDRAVETMKQAIASAAKSGEKFLSLREEALRDMAVFMTETGRVDEAIAYFQNVAGDKSFYAKVLEKLGKQYERNVEPAKATQVYESLLRTNPDDEAGFRVLVKLVDLDLRRARFREALERMKELKVPKGGEQDTQVAAQNLKAMVRRTATEHHESFRKKSLRSGLEVAEAYYTAYLNKFLSKDDPRQEIPEIEMYLAEVKRELGKSKEASALYRKVLESKDKRYAKEAGVLWTATLGEAMKKAPPRQGAIEPSETEKEFVDAADQLQENLGETPEGREAALKAAQVLAGYKETRKNAIKRIKKIIELWPKSQQSLTAARLWVQLYADQLPSSTTANLEKSDVADDLKEVMAKLRENTTLMAADQEVGGGKLKAQMADLDSRFKIGMIAKEEREKDYESAAKGYEAFAAESAQKDVAEKAYSNAVSAYLRVGDSISVDRVTSTWLKRFSKSPKAIESTRSAATGVLIQGEFELAGRLFERAGSEGGDADSLETAGRVYEGVGDRAKMRQILSQYLRLYPNSKHKWTIALALARSFEADGQDSESSKTYKYCMAGPAAFEAECGARLADLYMKNQSAAEAKALYKKIAAIKSKPLSPFVAYARYRLAELMERDARFDVMQLPENVLKKALNQRLEFLEPLSRAYLSAVEAGGPWAIAALDRLANWALNFADDVDKIAPPSTANPASIEQFRKNLAGISEPLRKKAIATWTDGYNKAVAGEILSPALPLMADRLADLKVAKPARAQGYRGRFRLAGMPADGGSEGATAALKKTRDRLMKNAQDAHAWVDYGNLIWGQQKPLLAKIAYERALSLDPKSAAALNNQAVVLISSEGEEDWFTVAQANELLHRALVQDEFFIPAKMNLASLLNYYRLFPKAKVLWDQVLVKNASTDAEDGLAIAIQGMGAASAAEAAFKRATGQGGSQNRFANLYHEAARSASDGERCLSRLGDLDYSSIAGFEKMATDHLKRTCSQWKKEK